MSALPFQADASAYVRTFLAELSFCCKYGQKRTNEVCGEGCHYTGYLCYEVQTCPSNRLPISIRRYAQALAWVLRDKEVDIEHIRTILPYTCAHRIQWRDEEETQDHRDDVLPIHRAREAVRQVFRRYTEQSERIQTALMTANHILSGADEKPFRANTPFTWKLCAIWDKSLHVQNFRNSRSQTCDKIHFENLIGLHHPI